MSRTFSALGLSCLAVASTLAMAGGIHAQTAAGGKGAPPSQVKVDWVDPEITSFVQEKRSQSLQSLTPGDQAVLSRLKLPVIAFDRPPGLVNRAFSAEALPPRKRQIVTDPDNPVWYTIVDTYGDVTVTIDGDLRVQRDLPADTKIYTPPQGAAVEPEVNVIDSNVEEGMEGILAEYSLEKFGGVPYRVTIECTPATKQMCADKAGILRDREALQIISARPPQ
ncbi:MAG: hypothetical protein NW217_10840 [Hyphomicrobiaceae bacterium]|nr:hypothetical protein [Hyphomicrobiaceae bacterium]